MKGWDHKIKKSMKYIRKQLEIFTALSDNLNHLIRLKKIEINIYPYSIELKRLIQIYYFSYTIDLNI